VFGIAASEDGRDRRSRQLIGLIGRRAVHVVYDTGMSPIGPHRFTDRTRDVLVTANKEAHTFNHECIEPEHILLGLAKEGGGVAVEALKSLGVDPRQIRIEIRKRLQTQPDMVAIGKLPLADRAKKVLERAVEEAHSLNHNYVGTEHILLSLLREPDGIAAQVLTSLGLQLEAVRKEVLDLLQRGREAARSSDSG
jgi:ATP-dependent Clp protease ATP-binding subunit ClpC